jgi:hypothetical protein
MTIASVTGVFLGLYFTAISIVASSVFATVPSDVRELLLKEKVGNVYIRILSVLLAVSVILLGYRAFNHNPGALITLAVLLFGCFSIFGFVVLGLRVFFFFDPTTLVDSIFGDLYNNIALATIKGLKWHDANFQAHYQKLASRNIATLKDVVEFCARAAYLQKRPLSIVLQKTCYFLRYYQKQKHLIPTNSNWFARVPKYKDTFLADVSALTVALQSQTSIQPETIPDFYWLEDEVIDVILSALQSALDNKNLIVCIDVIDSLNNYLEVLGLELEAEQYCKICGRIEGVFEKYFMDLPPKYLGYHDDMAMALFDRYNLSIMFCALGFYKFNREFNTSLLDKRLNSIVWGNRQEIYQKHFPPALLERLEFLQKRLEFEQRVEERIISPDWYRKQLVVMKYGQLLHTSIEQLLSIFDKYYVEGGKKFFDKKHFILAAWRFRKGLEAYAKMQAHFAQIRKVVTDLEKMNIEKELPWPKWDWDNIVKRINDSHDNLTGQLAQCIPSLSLMKASDKYPDLFGESYHIICQECFSDLADNKVEGFKSMFPFLFIGSLQAHERLKTSCRDYPPETLILVAFEPLLDIIELSGYAKIYSELYNSPDLWNTCEKSWAAYLKERGDKKDDVIKAMVSFYEYRASRFQLFSRDIWKTNWKMELERKLREMNLIDDMLDRSSYPGGSRNRNTHQSLFIRALCRGRYAPFITSSEIFILTYLLKQYQGKDIDFKDRHDFIDNLNEETNKNGKKNGNSTK